MSTHLDGLIFDTFFPFVYYKIKDKITGKAHGRGPTGRSGYLQQGVNCRHFNFILYTRYHLFLCMALFRLFTYGLYWVNIFLVQEEQIFIEIKLIEDLLIHLLT